MPNLKHSQLSFIKQNTQIREGNTIHIQKYAIIEFWQPRHTVITNHNRKTMFNMQISISQKTNEQLTQAKQLSKFTNILRDKIKELETYKNKSSLTRAITNKALQRTTSRH